MLHTILGRFIAALLFVVCCLARPAGAQDIPKFAVWDPQGGTTEIRFRLDPAELDKAAATLREGGLRVDRVTSAQVNDPAAFSAARYDALFLPGETFPNINVAALRRFSDEGGVLVAFRTYVPFLIAIEQEPVGRWTMTPKTPTFAWQKPDITNLFGLKYNFKPELHDSGVSQEPSLLFKKYLPTAKSFSRKMPGRWIYPAGDAEMYPLLRSRRPDGEDVTPQIFVARQGKHVAIVAGDGYATTGIDTFASPKDTLLALARLASDLKRGKAQLDPATKLMALDKLSLPGPLEGRPGTASIEPDGAKSIARWGRFNGSSLDLEKAGAANTLTRSISPGTTISLPLTSALPTTQPLFLRVRGAFNAPDAGLKLSLKAPAGEQILWNEVFNYIDASGPSNFNGGMAGLATEFSRVMYVPAMAKPSALLVSNPGAAPVYFDAIQLETRTRPAPDRIIGLGAGAPSIPTSYSRAWTNIRVNPRPQYVGPPGDPKRWEKMDKVMAQAVGANTRIQLVLEGTPNWAPISEERMALGKAAGRPHTVPPDTAKFVQLVQEIIQRYGDKVDSYEIWNEPDIQEFWRGTSAEYVSFFKTMAPMIRKLDPTAQIISAGMSGFKDPWVQDMVTGGIPRDSDLFAFHPYAGKSAGWDTGYGLVQGALWSRGQDREIFCDESGFVFMNTQWFQPPPVNTPATQARLLDVAMSRLLANDLAKLSVFNAGGDGNPFGLFDAQGKPLPAYEVFSTYLPLGQNGGRRLDVSLTSLDGKPLQGIYAAASTHSDGSATIVLNPSEVESLQVTPDPSNAMDSTSGWTAFFGQAKAAEGRVTVTPDEGKKYAGFYTPITRDPARFRYLEVTVPQAEGGYDLLLKLAAGKTITAATAQRAGTWRGDLDQLLPAGTRQFELSFRVFGPTSIDSILFIAPDQPAAAAPGIPVRLLTPLATANAAITATSQGETVPVKAVVHREAQTWAEITLDVRARTTVTLKPQ